MKKKAKAKSKKAAALLKEALAGIKANRPKPAKTWKFNPHIDR